MHWRQRLRQALPPALVEALRHLSFITVPRHKIGQFAVARHTRAILHDRKIDFVIDVGANAGQFGQFMRQDVGYRGPIVSFEPSPETFGQLQAASAGDPDWKVCNIGLGRERGVLPLNVMASSVFSSFRAPQKDNLFAELNAVVSRIDIKIERLDDFIESQGFGFKRAFLKIDTQGYDLEVLHGAERLIDHIEAIETELSFQPIYQATPAYEDVLKQLRIMGFVVSGIYPVSLSRLQVVECDCILVRQQTAAPGDHIRYQDLLSGSRDG